MPESDDAREESRRDVLAARRARRAGVGDPAPLQRAESAEANVRTLETSLADLRRRLLETEHERERLAQQLAEREHELRRVKQREYAEQQLRVEAEEHFTRLRRGHHAELDRLRERLGEARAAAQLAQERGLRAEHERDELAAHLTRVGQSCERLQAGIAALAGVAAELRGTFERERTLARRRISELERALARAPQAARLESSAAVGAGGEAATSNAEEDARRTEMADALAAAVGRLRARATEPRAEPTPATLETPIAAAARPAPQAPLGTRSDEKIPTVVVVPRLFPGVRRTQPRLAVLGRRLGTALIRWSERSRRA
ncbi:MAG TPA: hypothetical protein VMS02_04770 [Solirubrobacteraceae bacterium]|nr:hypothetical protein [Solirubrobacteraceae bacterium]